MLNMNFDRHKYAKASLIEFVAKSLQTLNNFYVKSLLVGLNLKQ